VSFVGRDVRCWKKEKRTKKKEQREKTKEKREKGEVESLCTCSLEYNF
jgi:hypothetical protein